MVQSISYKPPHYTVFFGLPTLPPSQVQIFSSAPYSWTPSIYVLPLVWESMVLYILIFNFLEGKQKDKTT
jgi:hypothetical protein